MRWAIVTAVFFAGCGESPQTADEKQSEQTEKLAAEANREIGMPAITNFQEKRLAKMIFELRDQEDLTTYAYIVNLQGELIYLGRCIGFGLPYSVQYTNPQKYQHVHTYSGTRHWEVMPQPDPNMLFMPDGLSATWLMLVDEESGEARPVYVEPEIIVSPFKLHARKAD